MAAPVGNQFWKQRVKHGRNKIFDSADDLWKACQKYFRWVDKNPLYESKAFPYKGVVVVENIPKMRAMTITGLCLFLGISSETWYSWRNDKDFSDIITRVEEIIRTQKFEGASADLLNANIIARDLGLADKRETDHTTKGEKINLDLSKLSTDELKVLRKLHDTTENDS